MTQVDQVLVDHPGERQQADPECRPRQLLGPVELACERRRLLERPARLHLARRLGLLGAELEQQLEPARAIRLRGELERVERLLGQRRGVLVGEPLSGAGRRAGRVVDGTLDTAERRRLDEVVRELAQVTVEVAGVDLLEGLAELEVERDPTRGGHLRQQGLAYERMREGVTPRTARGFDEPAADRLGERRVDPFAVELGDALDHVGAKLAPAHRGDAEDVVGVAGEAVEATADHLAHPLRDRHLAPGLVLAEPPLGRHQPDHLADEERVAAGLFVDRSREVVGRPLDAGGELDVLGDPFRVEAPERHPPRPLDPGEVPERVGERVMAPELDIPVGADQEQVRPREPAGDEAQQEQRGLVGPMQVVEHDHQRPGARGADEEVAERVEEPEARLLGLHVGRLADVAEPVGDLGDDLGYVGGPAAELPAQPDRVGVADVRAQRLRPGPVRGLSLGLVAASPVDAGAADPGVGRELLGRPRLADPGIPRDQQQPPATGVRALELGAHLLELGVATDEHAPGQALERVHRGLGRGRLGSGVGRCLDLAPGLGGALRPVVAPLRQQPQDDPVERRGDLGPMARRGHRLRVQVLADDHDRVLARERGLAGEQLVEHRPERVEIGPGVGGAAEGLLGGQVGDGSDQHPLDRLARAAVGGREAEVAEPGGAVVAEPHVRRFQVAVDDPAPVGVLERPADVDRDRDRPLDLEPATLALLEHPGEIAAADVLADDERDPPLLARVEHPDDVRVLAELAHRARLAPGAGEHRLLDPLGVEHRHRDLALAGLAIASAVDPLATAAADQRVDPVAPGEQLWDVGRRLRSRRRRRRLLFEPRPAGVAESRVRPVDVAALRAAHLR